MNCPKCDRPMLPIPSRRHDARRFKCEWCRYSWEGFVIKVFAETGVPGPWGEQGMSRGA